MAKRKSRKAAIGRMIGLGFLETVIHVCIYLVIILVFIRAATVGYDFSYHVFGDPAMSRYDQSTISFEVAEGATAGDVCQKLEDAGLVKYRMAMMIKARLSDLDNSLVPGTYELSPSMTSDEILAILTTRVVEDGNEVQAGEDVSGQSTEPDSDTPEDTANVEPEEGEGL